MDATDNQTHTSASVPGTASLADPSANGDSPRPAMPYTCQTCAKRKVKCDKTTPICSSCRKAKLECIYQAPRPRKRKISSHLNGEASQPQDADSLSKETPPQETISRRWNEPDSSRVGNLVAGQGRSRYVESSLWRDFGDDEVQRLSDDEGVDLPETDSTVWLPSDPLSGAFLGSGPQQSLVQYHPGHSNAMTLWKRHVDNVEPLCKILHIPSISIMVETASQQPELVSKTNECLLFAIYHFAVFSMTNEDCAKSFGQSRASLMQRYHFAARQALVNAGFLRATEMSILQALVLFLLPCRYLYDPHTYWILTGVAVRIGQRMGLHRDGEKLGLPPFEVQMRRRLFYQLLPLDGMASQLSGSGTGTMPETWDTNQALNINDDDIWPDMTDTPDEKKGPTEMMFCLARTCIGKFITSKASWQFKDHDEAEAAIAKAESEIEERFIRYCDIVNPLHFLTIASARCGITAMRLRIRLPKVRNQTATEEERRDLLQLAQKIIDTDTAAYAHASLQRYRWHVRPFFLWGLFDSFILILTSLRRPAFMSPAETDAAWLNVEQLYTNHGELLESRRTLYLAFGRLALQAWDVNPPSSSAEQPDFIKALCSRRRKMKLKSREVESGNIDAKLSATTLTPIDESAMDADEDGFNVDDADWAFWEQLMQDNQMQHDQTQGGQWQD